MGLFENVKESIDGMGQVELSGVKLESADARLLDPGSLDLDRHVSMQPSAIAYYGAMKKESGRRLMIEKRSYDIWKKKQWSLAKAAVMSETTTTAKYKPTLADIEARYIVDNEPAINEWDKRVDKAQEEADTLEAWYDAWRQKSFSLRESVSIDEDERFNSTSSSRGADGVSSGFGGGSHDGKLLSSDRIRDLLNRRKEAKTQSV